MRVLLIHPVDAFDALDAIALVRVLVDSGHTVLSVIPSAAAEIARAIDPGLGMVEVAPNGAGDHWADVAGRVASFAPEAYAVHGEQAMLRATGVRGSLKGVREIAPRNKGAGAEPVANWCERVASELTPGGGREALVGARGAWSGAVVDLLRARAGEAGRARNDAASELREACADATGRIAAGLARAAEMGDAGRLIQTLRDALLHQARDGADLQTQLEARAATIQERDDMIAALRSQIDGLGLQLDRLHRVGAELQEAHRITAELRARLEKAQAVGDTVDLQERLSRAESKVQAQTARTAEVGAELERTHRIAGELKAQLESRNADVAALRGQNESLREQTREMGTLGAELRRMHDVANELKAQQEVRALLLAETEREARQNRTELESVRQALRESDARAMVGVAEAARAQQATEELVQTRVELTQAQARVETMRADLLRVRAERDLLDDVVAARDAEISEARTLLSAERRRREALSADRDRLRQMLAAAAAESALLRSRLGELLASRWRKIGQRLGLAMVMPWEREGRATESPRAGGSGPATTDRVASAPEGKGAPAPRHEPAQRA